MPSFFTSLKNFASWLRYLISSACYFIYRFLLWRVNASCVYMILLLVYFACIWFLQLLNINFMTTVNHTEVAQYRVKYQGLG